MSTIFLLTILVGVVGFCTLIGLIVVLLLLRKNKETTPIWKGLFVVMIILALILSVIGGFVCKHLFGFGIAF